jgi:hypothetical protein
VSLSTVFLIWLTMFTSSPIFLSFNLRALSGRAVLASFLLNEELGHLGRLGCTLCLIGSLIIILHAPEDKQVTTVDEILHYAIQPGALPPSRLQYLAETFFSVVCATGFLMYCFTVLVFALIMIYAVAPRYGRKNPLVYISICSLVGSVSVMAIKGFGVAVKLTLGGSNQFSHPSTYVFGIVVVVCILVQMNYFNKALDTFSTNMYASSLALLPHTAHLWFFFSPVNQREPDVLRRLLNRHDRRIAHPLPRLQHHGRDEHRIAPRRIYRHLPRRAPAQPLAAAPRPRLRRQRGSAAAERPLPPVGARHGADAP